VHINTLLNSSNTIDYSWDFRSALANGSSVTDSESGQVATTNGNSFTDLSGVETLQSNSGNVSLGSITIGESFSWEIYTNITSTGYMRCIYFDYSSGTDHFFTLFDTQNKLNVKHKNGNIFPQLSEQPYNKWIHVVLTCQKSGSNSTYNIYYNGSNVSSGAQSGYFSRVSASCYLGRDGSNSSYNCNANIRLFRMWDSKVLTSSDVTALYNNRDNGTEF